MPRGFSKAKTYLFRWSYPSINALIFFDLGPDAWPTTSTLIALKHSAGSSLISFKTYFFISFPASKSFLFADLWRTLLLS